jgi:Ran GTPase-activating protein (RanGAP) involved in mRNA processing and transport
LGDNKLRAKGILTILDVLGSAVEELVLDQNVSYNDDADTACRRLSEFVNTPTNNLVKLCIAGGPKGPYLRQRIIPLFTALRSNQTLTELDVSWNQMSDAGMVELAELIYANRTLLSLKIDGNFFGIAGLQAFLRALKRNTTLFNVPTPYVDLDRNVLLLSPNTISSSSFY